MLKIKKINYWPKQKNKIQKLSRRRQLLVAFCVFFCVLVILVVLEEFSVINIYEHKSTTTNESAEATETTSNGNSSPTPSPSNSATVDSYKVIEDANPGLGPLQTTGSITITRAGQNSSNKSIYIGTLIVGINTGTCTLELKQDNNTGYTTQVSVIQQNNVYACEGFLININNISSSGDWLAVVTVSNGTQTTSSTQTINGIIK